MAATLGIDIGGTFTDGVFQSAKGFVSAKVPSNPKRPEVGVLKVVEVIASKASTTVEALLSTTETFVHGCTIGTNAIIERSGARTALLTTRGHEDVLRIGRLYQKVAGLSESEILHTSRLRRPRPLIDASLVFGIHERVDRNGTILARLNEAQVLELGAELGRRGVGAVAVSYLWSFINSAHEVRTRELLQQANPALTVISLSSEIAPVLGEYERTVATVLNAYVGPALEGYLEPLSSALSKRGLRRGVQVFHSGGGMMSIPAALKRPIMTIDSGPAGGVVAGQRTAATLGHNVICADMGGTSFDVSVIWEGRAEEDQNPTIDQYSFRIPRLTIRSIGAGGGSIAWRDSAGLLRVGPLSAGSVPGPACYARGGVLPTVTDADVVLGLLNPSALLGGEMPISQDRAHRAFESLAAEMHTTVEEVAAGVVDIINTQMADLVRRLTVERGHDPREFTLLMYGGAGPTHGVAIAEDVGCRAVCFPELSTTFAAQGMASSDIVYAAERTHTLRSPFRPGDHRRAIEVLESLAGQVTSEFVRDGFDPGAIAFRFQAFVKYELQFAGVAIDLEVEQLSASLDPLVEAFGRRYSQLYGNGALADFAEVEISPFRVEGRIAMESDYASVSDDNRQETRHSAAPSEYRRARTARDNAWITVPVYRDLPMDRLVGAELVGPLIIERYGDSVLVPEGHTAVIHSDRHILVKVERG